MHYTAERENLTYYFDHWMQLTEAESRYAKTFDRLLQLLSETAARQAQSPPLKATIETLELLVLTQDRARLISKRATRICAYAEQFSRGMFDLPAPP